MRENLHSSGKRPILAGLLPGVQGEVPAGGRPYQKVPEMREDFHFSVKHPALAEVLPGMPGKVVTGRKSMKCRQEQGFHFALPENDRNLNGSLELRSNFLD